jgi:two-component system, OmpR family, phosphate regulon sensor histidine kinase PhoR
MRKKLFLLHGSIILLSLLTLLLVSIFSMNAINEKNTQKQLSGYLDVTRSVLNDERRDNSEADAIAKTGEIITPSNTSLRLTIIGLDGTVKYDSDKKDIEENHLSRPEIVNLGTFTTRYSSTMKTDMMYLAGLDTAGKVYVRVAIPVYAIKQQVNSTLAISLGVFVLVLVISIVIDYYAINSSLKPLKAQVNRLSRIVSDEDELPKEIEIESLAYQVDKTKDTIVEKIDSLTKEQEKLRFIINSMKQGLLIIDEKMNVILVNDYVKNIFHYSEKENASLFDITIQSEFAELFHSTLNSKDQQKEVFIENHYYLITTTSFEADWLGTEKKGVAFSFVDVTIDKNLEKAKRDFFANASHELKSPLTSIIGYSEMIKNGFVTDKNEVNEDLDRILFESKRMNEIVIEMLELSRLEAKAEEANKEEITIQSIINQEVVEFQTQIEEKNLTINLAKDDFIVYMNREDVQALIKNIFENAIRYNKDNGSITFIIDKNSHSLAIKDTGIGIPEKYKERIFERFFRVDKARSRKLGGTGLGLSIVKHICINNNIQIQVDSKESEYTIFELKFPL